MLEKGRAGLAGGLAGGAGWAAGWGGWLLTLTRVHHRFWFFKFAAAVGLTVGSFFISEGPFTTGNSS